MVKYRFLAAGILTLALLLPACAGTEPPAEPTPIQTDVPAVTDRPADSSGTGEQTGILSSFTTTDLEGNAVDQSTLADYDLTMVNVWATFCGPCLREMPDLGELAAEYRDKGVQIVGLVSDVMDADGSLSESQVDLAKDIVAETGADYRHLLPSADLYGILAQIEAVPTTFFVDSEGRQVGYAFAGAMEKDDWVETIDGILAEVAQ